MSSTSNGTEPAQESRRSSRYAKYRDSLRSVSRSSSVSSGGMPAQAQAVTSPSPALTPSRKEPPRPDDAARRDDETPVEGGATLVSSPSKTDSVRNQNTRQSSRYQKYRDSLKTSTTPQRQRLEDQPDEAAESAAIAAAAAVTAGVTTTAAIIASNEGSEEALSPQMAEIRQTSSAPSTEADDFKERPSAHIVARPNPKHLKDTEAREESEREKYVKERLSAYLQKGMIGAAAYSESEELLQIADPLDEEEERRRYIKPSRESMTKEQVEFAEVAKEAADGAEEFLARNRETDVESPPDVKPSVSFSEETLKQERSKRQSEDTSDEHSDHSGTYGALTLKQYRRRRLAKFSLCALILIAIPLAIGLGVAFRPNDAPAPIPVPSPPPVPILTSRPTPAPVTASRPTPAPTTFLRPTTQAPVQPTVAPLPQPTVVPTTAIPTATPVIVLPGPVNSIFDLLDGLP